jgi:hypothetical protein
VDALYGLPLGEFTAERNALAKQLRADGESGRAAEVGKLRKPDATAWALNQAVRGDPGTARAARRAGGALRRAQEDAVAGRGDRDGLRAAMREERDAVGRLVERAAEEAERAGLKLDRERAAATIHAANADDEVGAALDSGRLVSWAREASLGPLPPPTPKREPDTRKREARKATPRKDDARARRRAAERRQAGRAAESARKKRDRAADRVEKARAELARLEEAERTAAGALAEAEKRLGRLERET